MTIIIFYKVV